MNHLRLELPDADDRVRIVLIALSAIESLDIDTMTLTTVSGAEFDFSQDPARQQLLKYFGVDESGAARGRTLGFHE